MDDSPVTLADVMDGKGAPFVVGGVSFLIRPPTTEEYDDALAIERMVQRRWLSAPELQPLKEEPCSDAERATYELLIQDADRRFREAEDGSREKDVLLSRIASLQRALETRTLADETAGDRATLARDRYLTQRLIADENGVPLFDTKSKDFAAQWERLSISIKNAARPAVWAVLSQVRDAPFSLDRLRGRKPG